MTGATSSEPTGAAVAIAVLLVGLGRVVTAGPPLVTALVGAWARSAAERSDPPGQVRPPPLNSTAHRLCCRALRR
ncbi:hypothetical protein STRIP9103_09064 [Streptomyces ipomoeae 91-03]|uniref:Uncharacterized protein n=1 Tax=Streptomyces ipomoeae 91-03 TaxID=698759 RepID=L1KV52_9ACTN|nr:hypothetical protein STRIP9103_09064 [Streptomyces ipomoeae 91-03]